MCVQTCCTVSSLSSFLPAPRPDSQDQSNLQSRGWWQCRETEQHHLFQEDTLHRHTGGQLQACTTPAWPLYTGENTVCSMIVMIISEFYTILCLIGAYMLYYNLVKPYTEPTLTVYSVNWLLGVPHPLLLSTYFLLSACFVPGFAQNLLNAIIRKYFCD